MLASIVLVRRSTCSPLARLTIRPTLATAASAKSQDILTRTFSSDGNNDDRKNKGKGTGGGGGPRNPQQPQDEKPKDGNRGRRPRKDNFSEQYLKPAARGELKKHQSGVPKLTGRRPKGHGVRGADPDFPEEEMDFLQMEEDVTPVEFNVNKKSNPAKKTGSVEKNSAPEDLTAKEHAEVMAFAKEYYALINSIDEEKYYWNEMEYDNQEDEKKVEILENLKAEATRDADGNLVVEVNDETWDMFEGVPETKKEEERAPPARRGNAPRMGEDDVMDPVIEAFGMQDFKPPAEGYDEVKPLILRGPDMSDFVEAMMHHPTKFGELRYEAPHEESTREPLPYFPKNRINPPKEFVENHRRFIYVWGLPPLTVVGEPGDLENPLHCTTIQKQVGALFDVPSSQVSVASPSSAFVGFTTIEDHRFAVAVGPVEKTLPSTVTIEKFTPGKDFPLAKDSPDALVLLKNLPSGVTRSVLATQLFPSGTEVGELFGNFNAEDVYMLSPHSAVLKMDSAEVAEAAVGSTFVEERLVEFGQHRIQYCKARRELVFTGLHGGPGGQDRLRTPGDRLIVDGDMPTKNFYLSHASTLHLRNVDPSLVTKQMISDLFQPVCSLTRDVEGSVEFVTSENGDKTGDVYVGFDELGEVEAALQTVAKGGFIRGLGPDKVVTRVVKDRNRVKVSQRSSRSSDELLDSLQNWEQFVNPADLQELYDNGISKEALDEAFTTIRYQNPTFASLDQAMRSETLNPEKESGGMYKELVQTYVATLKECISTPENPGPIYESLFFPGEEIDTEIFDAEHERQEELRKRRENR